MDPDSNPITKINNQTIVTKTAQTNRKQNNTKTLEKRHLIIGTWNVRRGLVRRELEIIELLRKENLDVLFLTETDTKRSNLANYSLQGYSTHFQMGDEDSSNIRIVALVKDNSGIVFKLREDLMSKSFPSIWLEAEDKYRSKSLFGGFYRQWSSNGKLAVPEQISQIELFVDQINEAANSSSKIIIMGDANLCSNKWGRDDYDKKSISQPLIDCLTQNGMDVQELGNTFQADHACQNGTVAESALDHAYTSANIRDCVVCNKLPNSSSDHLLGIVDYSLDITKVRFTHSVTKRSFKNFSNANWNQSLAQEDWLDVEEAVGVNDMVTIFNAKIKSALDRVAPTKTFKIRSQHRFGLSDDTKELMKRRDRTRKQINKSTNKERATLLQQYKTLRNQVTSKIRKENVDYNSKRINEAKNERELWNIANEVLNPRKESNWNVLDKNGMETTEEEKVADVFNDYFIDKVEQLKAGIDTNLVEDPMARLKEKMKNNKNTLEFKTVTGKQLSKHLKKLNPKKSSGVDGLSQENLLLGKSQLLSPLLAIVNQSITDGEFPEDWKEAAVIPVLKKGNSQLPSNYRPVSCLPAASKVLEIVVCSQLSDYLELNNLLPNNQHGFRPKRSTMTAWQEIQLDWATKGEQDLVTGVLLWDLSAAFDTLDCNGVCSKLEIFGLREKSLRWIRSFLTGRFQRVRIGGALSSPRLVPTGVPQGGVLSPLVFVLFVSDLQEWLTHSTAPTYADDTTTGTSAKTIAKTIELMEEDANQVLKFMASNGLVANANKTSFLLLNSKQAEAEYSLKIGTEQVKRESTAKLLGMQFQDDLQWQCQVFGKGGMISALNSRLYIVRRLSNHLSLKSVEKVVDGLFTSKIRYGLHLLGKVRLTSEDPKCAIFKAIQLVQNKMLRVLNRSLTKDKVSIESMLAKFKVTSVNRLNAQAKLLEVWKALNIENYPLKLLQQSTNTTGVSTRADTTGRLIEVGKSNTSRNSSTSDAIRLWNIAPNTITGATSLYRVKKEIKVFASQLPI